MQPGGSPRPEELVARMTNGGPDQGIAREIGLNGNDYAKEFFCHSLARYWI